MLSDKFLLLAKISLAFSNDLTGFLSRGNQLDLLLVAHVQ